MIRALTFFAGQVAVILIWFATLGAFSLGIYDTEMEAPLSLLQGWLPLDPLWFDLV
jgi:hypothetical protein